MTRHPVLADVVTGEVGMLGYAGCYLRHPPIAEHKLVGVNFPNPRAETFRSRLPQIPIRHWLFLPGKTPCITIPSQAPVAWISMSASQSHCVSVDLAVAYLGPHVLLLCCGSRWSRRPSAKKFTPSTVSIMARPGKKAIHQAMVT